MNKKFISALLFGAMLLAPASMFVSCSYDDDIAELRDDLNATKTDLSSLLDEKMKNVDAEIVALGAQAEALDAAYKAADEALQEAIANATNDAKGYADVQAAQAQAASITAAQKMVEDAKAALEAALATVNSTVAEQGKSIAALVEADKELTSAITAAQARAEEAFALASQAKELATQNAAALKALEEAVKGLEATVATLSEQVNVLGEKVASLEKAAQDNAAAIAAQAATIEALKASNAAALESAKGELQTAIEANAEEIEALEAAVEAAKAEAATAIAEAKAVAAQAVEDAKAALTASFSDAIADAKAAYEAADKALADEIAAVKEIADKNAAVIDGIQKSLAEANSNLLYESKRLKSLVFAPTAYVNGVECIKFVTLKYNNWVNKFADAANGDNNEYYIDDATTAVEYLVNPKNVLKNDITALSFISNKASNTTRAVSEDAPIAVKSFDINNGVMSVVLDKEDTKSFGTSENNFTIVSLKATLSDKFLTEEEVENGEKAEVYSDWARLYETAVTPYIHNVLTNTGNHTHVEDAEKAHFWTFTEMYGANATDTSVVLSKTQVEGKCIAKEVVYTESIDLMTLVEVCDKDGNHYDPEAYGLEFRFAKMHYHVENENQANDDTDQFYFAKLDGTVLTSTARDNSTEKNRDAIGRQPAIQVVLFDKVNQKTVDVKYFKIKWIENTPEVPEVVVTVKEFPGFFGEYTAEYTCGNMISELVLEEKVNKLYTIAGTNGLSRNEFHNTYALADGLFASLEEIKKESPDADDNLGVVQELPDNTGAGETWNYKWYFNDPMYLTVVEYLEGKKVITAYGYFYKKNQTTERIAFKLQYTLTVKPLDLAPGYFRDQVMWKNDMRHVNPALESDVTYGMSQYKTTQMIGSLLKGYIKDGKTPQNAHEMINRNVDEAKFVFDEKQLSKLAKLGDGWSVSDDGSTLMKNLEPAATVNPANGTIQLYESNNGAADSKPSAAAKLLVGESVPVKIVGKWCNITEEIEHHDVKFLTPLEFFAENADVTLKDITPNGSKKGTIAGKLSIKEIFTTEKRLVWDNNPNTDPTGLEEWYQVQIDVVEEDAMTNISKDGVIEQTCNTKLAILKNQNNSQKYVVEVADDNSTVTFHNMSGDAIGQAFKIEIPVIVKTKWQNDMKAVINVTIEPNI